jgi:DNA/RNA-binding domain of Phe-tRNA-synthetase-like protein
LIDYIDEVIGELKGSMTVDEVRDRAVIAETKAAYRRLGKDPTRYRPSAEALSRRIVQGKGLYRVNNIVDVLNVVSVKHGFSIGGYDRECLVEDISLSIGRKGEPYEAIGRGILNIENLPVLRDGSGAFGSPTSDSRRTMVRSKTQDFVMIFFDFMASNLLETAMEEAESIYRFYCGVSDIEMKLMV